MGASEWWGKINNAARLIDDIVDNVVKRRQTVICTSGTPFPKELSGIAQDEICRQDSENRLTVLDDSLLDKPVVDLMWERCPEDVTGTYFPKKGSTRTSFICGCDQFSLNDSTVWVSGISDERLPEWIAFVRDYGAGCREFHHAAFVLETNSPQSHQGKMKNITFYSASDYITDYDLNVYYMLQASEISSCSPIMSQYIAELVTTLCGSDPYTAESMLSHKKEIAERPLELYEECGGAPLTRAELQSRLWKAQMRVLFPVIEECRCRIVNNYLDKLEKAMPFTTAYGVRIDEPFELDIGNILSMHGSGSIMLNSRDKELLSDLKPIRDDLAHMKPAAYDVIESMLG